MNIELFFFPWMDVSHLSLSQAHEFVSELDLGPPEFQILSH